MSLQNAITQVDAVYIRQRKELAELFGFETRNKYSIETEDGRALGFAAEQQKGIFGFFMRQMLGHWRSFEITIFDAERQPQLIARHPFRFFFQRVEVSSYDGQHLGAIQQRFSIITKKFDIESKSGQVSITVRSPFWRIWTFELKRKDQTLGFIRKKWGGLLKEAFLDADSFAIEYGSPMLSKEDRVLCLAAGLFVDLQYFNQKGRQTGFGLSYGD